ncbi:hypothetical protein FOPG_17061 [Fusarium oxysporum f. sp. conglutinans race 2 54008]|uniref:Uncharacterized protein n=1 Tax=Fusarium oxysporum f. sp. conglutinans race 2 54008 TaxID=1089457 RepID=X0H477_FUSOX|nr:hypothetical protein FOPG_17061 [Fusarium oxysporum f. sp. conglutinans race 2 54008]
MTRQDIDDVIAKFVAAAKLTFQSGFQGVEVHAGRGRDTVASCTFLMISNSHYVLKDPTSPGPRARARDAFFLHASQEIRNKFPDLVIILTGGFRSRTATVTALDSGTCSAVGIGRPAVKYPDLPNSIVLNKEAHTNQLGRFDVETAPSPGYIATKIRSIGAGAESNYWASRMKEI